MSRDGGFSIGDRSTRTLYDVRLVRATRRAGLGAIVAWDAILDASWAAGERIPFDDAVDTLPYDLGDTTAIREALEAVELLDAAGVIREESWAAWFETAYARREATRERGRRYNASRRIDVDATSDARRNDAIKPSNDKNTAPPSVRPLPTVRPTRAPARENGSQATTKRNGGGPALIGTLLEKVTAADPAFTAYSPAPKPEPRKRAAK